MKVVILCGGLGTRIRDQHELLPKPLVPIGPRPIVWHVMSHYAAYGHRDFVLCLGYKSEAFVDYFLNYRQYNCDLTVKLGRRPAVRLHGGVEVDWRVTLAHTGLKTATGARVCRARRYLTGPRFLLTYGDGLSTVDLDALLAHHIASGKLVTVSAVHPAGRFGEIDLAGDEVRSFAEKPQTSAGYINGGFMVLERELIDRYLSDDEGCVLEADALARCARDGELAVYRHEGFWQCMDTPREHQLLEELWNSGRAPWATGKPGKTTARKTHEAETAGAPGGAHAQPGAPAAGAPFVPFPRDP
jgi:glucose-1-phosphate cytidylyltransferase